LKLLCFINKTFLSKEISLFCADTAFTPAPKVNAAVVTLIPLKKPRLQCKFDTVSRVVKAVFQFKNKKWTTGA
jgi:16S rRNA A1518/A1519 N6-dimethyltransferase RsmA/KsgA/DIM1 with predicted DNA glycosylase/AP lyase activity